MIRTALLHLTVTAIAAVGLGIPTPAPAAHHEGKPVVQAVTVKVLPGKEAKYAKQVKRLSALLAETGGQGTMRMWTTVLGGDAAGNVLVGIEYPNAAAWAKTMDAMQANPEWRKIIGGLGKIRTVESTALWTDISPNPVKAAPPRSGTVLAITAVQVKPGRLDDYRSRVGEASGILDRLGLAGRVRMWQAEIAGTNTGAVVVGVEYPSLAAYTADQAKLEGDREWRRLLRRFRDVRTVGSHSLFQEITP